MNNLEWCKSTFENKTCQSHLEEKLSLLLVSYFKGKEDYPIEKFIKSFSEGLRYLESLLLMKKGIHNSQLKVGNPPINMKDLATKHEEIEKILLVEIDRQYRNFITFLAVIKK